MRAYVPRSERISVNREFAAVEEHLSEYVTNISRTGAFIRSREPLPIGTRVNLKFSLILDEIEFIEGIGEVVRISQNPPGMGVVFRQLTAESQALVERLCQAAPKHERQP